MSDTILVEYQLLFQSPCRSNLVVSIYVTQHLSTSNLTHFVITYSLNIIESTLELWMIRHCITSAAPNENIVQNHLNIALLNVLSPKNFSSVRIS